jgi:GcrA cell cycle regulator
MDAEQLATRRASRQGSRYPRWTPEQDQTLRELRHTHKPEQIARLVGRSHKAVNHRAHLLGMEKLNRYTAWVDPTLLERVKLLWLEGKSATEIAQITDCGLTRCAIIGKLHREGLSNLRPPSQPKQKQQPKPKRNHNPFHYGRKPWRPKRETEATGVPSPNLPSLNLSILEVKNGQCKYMAGEDHLCCAHPVVAQGSSWCASHYRVVCGGNQ